MRTLFLDVDHILAAIAARAAGAIDPHEIEAVAQWAGSFTTDRPDEHLARCRLLDLTSRYINGLDSLRDTKTN